MVKKKNEITIKIGVPQRLCLKCHKEQIKELKRDLRRYAKKRIKDFYQFIEDVEKA